MSSKNNLARKVISPSNYITIEELYNDYEFDLQFDDTENGGCYYLEDPDDDDDMEGRLTPCFHNIYDLEKWINEHWDEVSRGLTKRQEGEAEEMHDFSERIRAIKDLHGRR